jgi:catechol-2,3-dioxygenase
VVGGILVICPSKRDREFRKKHEQVPTNTSWSELRRIAMAKLRHLALLTHQPERLADFYKKVFELEEVFRTKNGSVHLSDGEVNLAILNANDPKDPEDLKRMGMYHFGFHVDDQETVAQRIQELYPEGAPKKRPSGTSYAETRGADPDGNIFDISTWGWSGKPLPKDKGGPEQQ